MLTAKCNHVHFSSFVRLTCVSVLGFCLVPKSSVLNLSVLNLSVLGRSGPSDRPEFFGVLCVAAGSRCDFGVFGAGR